MLSSWINRYKIQIFITFLIITVIFIWSINESLKDHIIRIGKKSFVTTPSFTLVSIDEADVKPCLNESHRQIFFLETTCAEKCECHSKLSDRVTCGIESTARLHPTYKIYVLIVNSDKFEVNHKEDLLQKMFEYENVFLRKINLFEYSKNTPLEQFFLEKRYIDSQYMRTHLSDILRILTLWKYGGVYLDSDIVCLKNLKALGMNWASYENYDTVTGSMINFGNDELGRRFAQDCLIELNNTFDGSYWATNGPGLITRVLNRLCNTSNVDEMSRERCEGFTVLPKETFAPIPWQLSTYYFTEDAREDVMNKISYYKPYIAHIFNHMSSEYQVMKTANVAYALLAKEFCPDMFNSSGTCF